MRETIMVKLVEDYGRVCQKIGWMEGSINFGTEPEAHPRWDEYQALMVSALALLEKIKADIEIYSTIAANA
jgi:hypothetical protein